MDKKTCIAVDIGGTKMLVAEVCEDGSILHELRIPTGKISRVELISRIKEGVRNYEKEYGWSSGKRPQQMGIGINTVVDPVRGVCKKLEGVYGEEVPLVEIMETAFGITCYLDNDVKAAVIAESIFGAGKDCLDMTYINIGTGMAAGSIANGKLIRGSDGFAGEVGYMNFNNGEGPWIELIASGMGINHRISTLLDQYPDSFLKDEVGTVVSGQKVFELAEKGDLFAIKILDDMVKTIALLISNITCVLSPELIVIGGGLISNGILLERVIDTVSPKAKEHIEKGIVLTELHPAYAGLLGAAAVGFGYQEQFK